jgi:phosphomannomutase
MKRSNTTFSSLIDSIRTWAFSGEINFRIEGKDEAMAELYRVYAEEAEPEAVYDFDGYRIEFRDWWFNVRPSNTEPYLRLVVEAKEEALLEEKVAEIRDKLSAFE